MSSLPARRPTRELVAFLDESGSDRGRDPGTYVLAAAVCAPDAMDDARAMMGALRLKGQIKLHWRNESHQRRLVVVEAISRLDLMHLVVVRQGALPSERAERRRRHCLERMLHELDQLAVATAVFESRGPADDRCDRAMLDALRARRIVVRGGLRVEHVRGPREPMLWVPDALCGAVSQQRTGEPAFLEILGPQVQVITIMP